ncbi:MAG: hypothetical protein COW30_12970 [Rhodospirillales bacterium CG15_BIG_FIL_POST_REV_8_21_14_020_66_15]|nr:MAG: hypothetical protein COW30_12970 [Rhodospirillales bacterium CG15_BIG_FIL_POST_REV_8_21_14_020_66_15]
MTRLGKIGGRVLLVAAALVASTATWAAPDVKDVERVDRSVVRIVVELELLVTGADGRMEAKKGIGTGTGFVINGDGAVVTNRHVVYPDSAPPGGRVDILKNRIWVIEHGAEVELPGDIVQTDKAKDLAVIKVQGLKSPPLKLATAVPEKGRAVHSLGFPGLADAKGFSKESTLSTGIVEKTEQVARAAGGRPLMWLQHSATVRQGNSGGPLFNDCGEVVGVNTMIIGGDIQSGGQGKLHVVDASISVASHAAELAAFLKSIPVPFEAVHGACAAKGGLAAAGLTTANMLIAAAAVLALIVAILNRRQISSAARSVSRVVRRPADEASPGSRPAPPQEPAKARDLVPPSPDADWLVSGSDGQHRPVRFEFSARAADAAGGNMVIGRDVNLCDLVVDSETLSARHLRLIIADGGLQVEDLGSTNGSRAGGRPLPPFAPERLPPGVTLELGDTRLTVTFAR